MDPREQIWCNLITAYDRRLRAYLRRIPCSADELEQIVWDVWALAVAHEDDLKEGDCWPMIATLVREACLPQLRIWRHEHFRDPPSRLADMDDAIGAGPDDESEWKSVRAAMEQLSSQQRWAVDYRYRWGWPYWAVAAALECTPATARVHAHRRLIRLRTLVARVPITNEVQE